MPREKALKVAVDRVVVLTFTLTDGAGKTLAEATDAAPFVTLVGHGAMLPRLEEALIGHEVGDRFEVSLDRAEGFGTPMDEPERVVPRNLLPSGPLAEGLSIQLRDGDEVVHAWVVREAGAHVVVSLSHPLATTEARFVAEVQRVREATEEELADGYATEIGAGEDPAPPHSDDESSDDESSHDESSDDESSDGESSDDESSDDESSIRKSDEEEE